MLRRPLRFNPINAIIVLYVLKGIIAMRLTQWTDESEMIVTYVYRSLPYYIFIFEVVRRRREAYVTLRPVLRMLVLYDIIATYGMIIVVAVLLLYELPSLKTLQTLLVLFLTNYKQLSVLASNILLWLFTIYVIVSVLQKEGPEGKGVFREHYT